LVAKIRTWFIIGLTLLSFLIALPLVHAQEETKPSVRGYFFYSQTCLSCPQIRTEILPRLYMEYGQQLQITSIDVQQDGNQEWLLACQREYGLPEDAADVPVLFIGDEALVGAGDIAGKLPDLIQGYAAGTGVDYPDVPRPDGPLEPTLRFMFFYSPDCPHCREVEETVLPPLKLKYGERLEWLALDRSDEANYRALLILGEMTGLPQEARGAVPLIFVGDEYSAYARFLGGYEIAQYLGPALDWYSELGGVDLPQWKDELFDMASTPVEPTSTPNEPTSTPPSTAPTQTLSPTATPSPAAPIHVAYFEEAGCSECDAVSAALEHVQNNYPQVVVHKLDILDDIALNLCLSERLNVPEAKQHDAPAVFVGTDYLVGKDVHYESLLALVGRYVETGAEPTWETCETDETELPPPPPWWAVILPGLGDGINPCAFATIIFFVSYLSLIERKGREILLVGLAFTLAVFLSYLAFGIILRELLSGLIAWTGPVLRPILNAVMAVVCIVLAILSLGDFLKARQGDSKEMTLRLPDKLRKWINATIRKSMRAETLVIASFAAGVIISFIELACTGQVYVPIILGLSTPGYRSHALLSLIVYCLAFVVPLIVVFIISFFGANSRKLGMFLQQHTANIKLLTAVIFVAIGLWLIYETLQVWGVIAPWFASA
jgi:cytochrome c biogenesis protein CcdA/thiol-disulfide isomerase/thioredoxin